MRRRTALPLLSLVLLTGCSAGTDPEPAGQPQIEGVTTYPYVAPDHQAKDYDYPQAPPVGGDHWPPTAGGVRGWLACGVYDRTVPDEFAVHSMEHGAVWLTYRPGAPAEQVAALEALADLEPEYVLVTPYEGQSGAFGATTWGAQLFVDAPDDPRLERFVETYAGGAQGREQGADCVNGTSPDDAQAALDAAG